VEEAEADSYQWSYTADARWTSGSRKTWGNCCSAVELDFATHSEFATSAAEFLVVETVAAEEVVVVAVVVETVIPTVGVAAAAAAEASVGVAATESWSLAS